MGVKDYIITNTDFVIICVTVDKLRSEMFDMKCFFQLMLKIPLWYCYLLTAFLLHKSVVANKVMTISVTS